PLEDFLQDRGRDFPFCIMWANENWTRRWDGSETELLMKQDYSPGDADALIDDIARHFRDPRYIRVGGRPLFFIYRAGIIPEATRTMANWRELFRKRHDEDPLILITQTFTDHDPNDFGADGAIEFPPHRVVTTINPINAELNVFDPALSAVVYRYHDVARVSLSMPVPPYPLIRTLFPAWDNDA